MNMHVCNYRTAHRLDFLERSLASMIGIDLSYAAFAAFENETPV